MKDKTARESIARLETDVYVERLTYFDKFPCPHCGVVMPCVKLPMSQAQMLEEAKNQPLIIPRCFPMFPYRRCLGCLTLFKEGQATWVEVK